MTLVPRATPDLAERLPADAPPVPHLVLTGGPHGGKTMALAHLTSVLTGEGWRVFTVPELATALFTSGTAPADAAGPANVAFRRELVRGILRQEATWRAMAALMPGTRRVLVSDRGIFDDFAYVAGWEEMDSIFVDLGLTRAQAYARYDAVFHLVSAADGAPAAYVCATNAARQEATLAAARTAERRTRLAWAGHPRVTVLENVDATPAGPRPVSFPVKLDRLTAAIRAALAGLPGAAAA